MTWCLHLLLALALPFLLVSSVLGDVTYDGRSLIINGERKILFSGSIHYPRSTPDMWPSLISKAKRGGLNVIQSYVFWNLHEPQPDQYDFSGRRDLVRFVKEVGAQGLYVSLRVGPFIQSEWSYGGFPFWLHDVPNIVFRSDNEPFKEHMQRFTSTIVNLMKSENLYASQGGPIIISQIENEYGTVEAAFHTSGPAYVKWAASMAVGLQTGVPWMMCKQPDAPDPVINTCNGMRCGQTFQGPNSPSKPSMWTENWTSFYQAYGSGPYIRSAEDIAFQVALFIAKNGSFVNYYMYHGGTNFGRSAAAYFITSYYDQAPLDEYGLLRQPKWGHLKDLHEAIRICSGILLSRTASIYTLGQDQKAYVFAGEPGKCAAFLLNENNNEEVTVQFTNSSYLLPPHSISILPDCKTEAFNTAKVKAPGSKRYMMKSVVFDSDEQWKQFKDEVPTYDGALFRSNTVLDQMSMTKDTSDYLWYTFSFENGIPDTNATLSVGSRSHALHAFVNGKLAGSAHGSRNSSTFSLVKQIPLKAGANHISLLSVMVGLPDSGAYLERKVAGLRRVRIHSNRKTRDFTNYAWGYQVGLKGEELKAYSQESANEVGWGDLICDKQPLKWYKTTFDAPKGNLPLTLNLASMRKGEAWVNGQSIGRYWVAFRTSEGVPSQSRYHIPRSFLKPAGNSLVILEEETGKPRNISIDIVVVRYTSQNGYSTPSDR